jgi:putative ATP-binding cassette transporter
VCVCVCVCVCVLQVRDWGDELSLGEQQRLGFARLLVNKPQLAILDEATSALDLENEAIMYEALAKLPGITYLSVGHRPSLVRFHTNRLRLLSTEAASSFALEAIDDAGVRESLEANLAL